MYYNKELAKRFVSDFNLPIPIIGGEEYFSYYLNLYEDDYDSLTKYKKLLNLIQTYYGGDSDKFLEEFYNIRENIISSVTENTAFKKFNTMDMSVFAIKNMPKAKSKNIYNNDNIGRYFLSVDITKANFQTLRNINKDIVFGADTYEEFIDKFTGLQYVKQSKYCRQVIFGKLNPSRHITAEKYFMKQIYDGIIEKIDFLKENNLVSFSNDEIVFDVTSHINSINGDTIEVIQRISKSMGFKVHVDVFMLHGFNVVFKESRSIRNTFYTKEYLYGENKFKLISLPLQYHALIYSLYKGLTPDEKSYHFNYEGINAKFCEEFDIEKIG